MSENKQLFEDTGQKAVLLVEPFYSGSHKQLIDFLINLFEESKTKFDVITLPGKKWHWRARTGALFMSKNIPKTTSYRVIFCSSTLNLAELLALRPELNQARKIVYFHENQFVYPKQNQLDRDFQYGYNTILSALVADCVVFNSHYNKETFLNNINKHLRKQPDYRVGDLKEEIEPKTTVIYFPITLTPLKLLKTYDILHIVWPHRWEHDKDPELFFQVLFQLKDEGLPFRVSVLGESFTDPPIIFAEAREKLYDRIHQFGRLENKTEYEGVLQNAHVVISTAQHEFYGVAMLEAVFYGCLPLAPNNLVYPEIYPKEYLYNTKQQLLKKLKKFCKKPEIVENILKKFPINLSRFNKLTQIYTNLFQ